MECADWIDSAVLEAEGYFDSDDDLGKLRNHVLETRGEDIGPALYIYENRVLYYEVGQNIPEILDEDSATFVYSRPFSWEFIRKFPYTTPDGQEAFHEIGKRDVKRCFLRAWLEIALWERGEEDEDGRRRPAKPLLENDVAASALPEKDENDQFLLNESVALSLDMMRKYHDAWLATPPKDRGLRPRFYGPQMVARPRDDWRVHVPADLWRYYYDEEDGGGNPSGKTAAPRISGMVSRSFPPAQGEWKTLTCLKKTETRHAVVSNFISWQEWLSAVGAPEGADMNENRNISKKYRDLTKEAKADDNDVSPSVKAILYKISHETGMAGLTDDERKLLENESALSPKVRLLTKMARLHHARSALGASEIWKAAADTIEDEAPQIATEPPAPVSSEPQSGFLDWLKRFFRQPMVLAAVAMSVAAASTIPLFWSKGGPSIERFILTGHTTDGLTLQFGGDTNTRGRTPDDFMLRSGESFTLAFAVDRDGFAAVISLDSQGRAGTLFSENVKAGQTIRLPKSETKQKRQYVLDDHPGMETLMVFAWAEPIAEDELKKGIDRIQRDGPDAADKVFPDATVEILEFRHE